MKNRKIYLIANVGWGTTPNRPYLVAHTDGQTLPKYDSEGIVVSYVELEALIGVEAFAPFKDTMGRICDTTYFKRRAHARKCLAACREDDPEFFNECRIIEVGEFDREVLPVSHWKVVRYLSTDSGKTWDSGALLRDGITTRQEARAWRDDFVATQGYGSPPDSIVKWKHNVVPVYASQVCS